MDGMMIVLRSAKTLPLLSAAEITDQPCVEIGDAVRDYAATGAEDVDVVL